MGKEINDLLKYGAYDLFREDEEGKGGNDIFGEDDIDKILERASTVVRYERAEENNTGGDTEGAAGAKDKKGSTFSKAFFSSSHADTDIDINAENFWELVLPGTTSPATAATAPRACILTHLSLRVWWGQRPKTLGACWSACARARSATPRPRWTSFGRT